MTADELFAIELIADDLASMAETDELHQLQAYFYNRHFGVAHRLAGEIEEAQFHEEQAESIMDTLKENL